MSDIASIAKVKKLKEEVRQIRSILEKSFENTKESVATENSADILQENKGLKLKLEEKENKINKALEEIEEIKIIVKDTVNSL